MDSVETILAVTEGRSGRFARLEGDFKGLEFGADDVGDIKQFVEVLTEDFFLVGPLTNPGVAPGDLAILIEQHNAVGHGAEDLDVVKKLGGVGCRGEAIGIGVDAVEPSLGQSNNRLGEGANRYDLHCGAEVLREVGGYRPVLTQAKNLLEARSA